MTLTDLAVLIQDTGAAIRQAEKFLGENPADLATVLNLTSLQKRHSVLQAQFVETARMSQVEVLYYRLFTDPNDAPLIALNEILGTFQQAFSVIYDAIATGTRKTRARLSEKAAAATRLNYAYSFAGSVGFALTLPREPTLLANDHDAAIAALRRVAVIANQDDVRTFVNDYGLAAVRTAYSWLDAIAKNDLDSGVEWEGAIELGAPKFIIEAMSARAVREIIANTAAVDYEDRAFRGTLLGYDWERGTFRFAIGDRKPIHGTVSSAITGPLNVPARYDVEIRITTTHRYSTEEKEEKFELRDIRTGTPIVNRD